MAIINGETVTGITTMLTERGVDCGDILLQEVIPIPNDITAGELFDQLAELGSKVLIKTLDGIENKIITPVPQNHEEATHFPMFKKEDGRIDWNKSAQEVHNLVRGVNPWPSAFTSYNDTTIKLHKSMVLDTPTNKEPGTIIDNKEYLDIACSDKVLRVLECRYRVKENGFRTGTSWVQDGYRRDISIDDR